MNIFQTSLALVATNIGGAILAIPYAFYNVGLINGLIALLAFAIFAHISNSMYLAVKDLTPRRYESIYEIAYLLLGRSSIFILCTIIYSCNLLAMVMYYIVIGDTTGRLAAQFFVPDAPNKKIDEIKTDLEGISVFAQVISHRTTSILFVGCLSMLFIFKKRLEELKSVSYAFITIVFLFVALFLVELIRDEGKSMESYEEITALKPGTAILTAFGVFIFTYAFQFMVFPAYVELENRSNERFNLVSITSISIYTTALVSVGIIAVLLFGKDVKPDILDNLASRKSGVSIFLRALYMFILLFHLPYYFFAVKEYALVIFDELMNKSLSTHLEIKLAEFIKKSPRSQAALNEREEEKEPILNGEG